MAGVSGNTGYEDNSAWIDITVAGEATISSVEISGISGSSGGSNFIAGFSEEKDGNNYADGQFVVFAYTTGCTSYSLTVPSGKEIKSIRLIRSRNFAGEQTNDVSGAANIKDLTVTLAYLPSTGMEETPDAFFDLYASPIGIHAVEPARIEIYALSGMLLKSVDTTRYVSTEELSKEIYLVKAVSVISGKQKIIRIKK